MFAVTLLILSAAVNNIHATESRLTLKVESISCNQRIIVKLLCEGVNLTQLRWSYPPLKEILTFAWDELPNNKSILGVDPDILSVQLLDVKNVSIHNRVNFSSVVTFDLLRLKDYNITRISCDGGVGALVEGRSVAELVNSSSTAINLELRATATYQEGTLTDLKVQWRKLFDMCLPEYTVSTTGSAENVYSCDGQFCEVMFTSPNIYYDGEGNTQVSVVAVLTNEQTKSASIVISQKSDQYFIPHINYSACSYTPHCQTVYSNSTCTVHYTTSLSTTTQQLSLQSPVPQQSPGTVHTFNFSLEVDEQLYITDTISVTDSVSSLGLRDIIILTMACIFLLLTFAHFVLVLIGGFSKNEVFRAKIKVLISSMIALVLLILLCISLMIAFGVIIRTTACGFLKSSPRDSILETMLVASCLGLTLLIIIWGYLGYTVYKRHKSTSVSKTPDERPEESTVPYENDYYSNQFEGGQSARPPGEDYSTLSYENDYYNKQSNCIHTESLRSTCVGNREPVGEEYSIIQHENDFYNSQNMDVVNMDPFEMKSPYTTLQRPRSFLEGSCIVDNDYYRTKSMAGASPYEQLRAGEKSKPVPNMLDPTYQHIGRQQFEPVPDLVFSHSEHNMRDNYNVLSRPQSMCVSVHPDIDPYSVYGELDESCMEPTRGEGPYLPLRMMEKSKPVPNLDDPSYSHIHPHTDSLSGETEAAGKSKEKNKKRIFKIN